MTDKAERKFIQLGDKLEKKIEDNGWKNKINYFFMDKMKIRKIQQKFNPSTQPAKNGEIIESMENEDPNTGQTLSSPQEQ